MFNLNLIRVAEFYFDRLLFQRFYKRNEDANSIVSLFIEFLESVQKENLNTLREIEAMFPNSRIAEACELRIQQLKPKQMNPIPDSILYFT